MSLARRQNANELGESLTHGGQPFGPIPHDNAASPDRQRSLKRLHGVQARTPPKIRLPELEVCNGPTGEPILERVKRPPIDPRQTIDLIVPHPEQGLPLVTAPSRKR